MDHVLMYIHNYQIDIVQYYILDHIDYYYVLMNNYLLNMYQLLVEYDVYLQQEFHNIVHKNLLDIDIMINHHLFVNIYHHLNKKIQYIEDFDNFYSLFPVNININMNLEYSKNTKQENLKIEFYIFSFKIFT